jgi:hypothetical protein
MGEPSSFCARQHASQPVAVQDDDVPPCSRMSPEATRSLSARLALCALVATISATSSGESRKDLQAEQVVSDERAWKLATFHEVAQQEGRRRVVGDQPTVGRHLSQGSIR